MAASSCQRLKTDGSAAVSLSSKQKARLLAEFALLRKMLSTTHDAPPVSARTAAVAPPKVTAEDVRRVERLLAAGKPRASRALWQTHSYSSLAADALYMVGSIELDKLRDPAHAIKRFKRYLRRYPRGRQREGAFLLLVRAATRAGNINASCHQWRDRQYTSRRGWSAMTPSCGRRPPRSDRHRR
ncbi:MAG: hypothetical protein JRH20_02165 [Deltaproteobacteria bacterium]|nr:hypothetical protein [Deltaproteobacteria bacterium]